MKKLLSILLAAAVTLVLALPAAAAETGIRMADIAVQEGEMVYIPVSLEAAVTATAVGLSYTYDSGALEICPEECRWIPKGMLNDFSKTGPEAVWASKGATELSGDLCVLAFRIVNVQNFRKTEISCSVTVKNGGDTAGVYQDSAEITKVCAHQFGDWADKGSHGHARKCTLCGIEEQQSHDWDAGTRTTDPDRPNVTLLTHRCTICSAEEVSEIPGGVQVVVPTYPEATRPSQPEDTMPEATRPQPTYPQEQENQPTRPGSGSEDTGHTSGSSAKPSGNGGSSSQNGNPSVTIPQPQDYNRKQQTGGQDQKNPASAPVGPGTEASARDENAADGEIDRLPPETTHPMAIKIEGSEEAPAEETPSEKNTEAEGGSPALWLAAGVAAAVMWLVLRKRKR